MPSYQPGDVVFLPPAGVGFGGYATLIGRAEEFFDGDWWVERHDGGDHVVRYEWEMELAGVGGES